MQVTSATPAAAVAPAAAASKALAAEYFNTGKKPTMYVDAFLAMNFKGTGEPVTDWPKIENGRTLPDGFYDAVDTVLNKAAKAGEFVAGGVLRVVDRGIDYVYDRSIGVPTITITRPTKEKSYYERAKETVTGWFSKKDKKEEPAKGANLTVVKSDKPAEAETTAAVEVSDQQILEHLTTISTVTGAIMALGEEDAKAFSAAADAIDAKAISEDEKRAEKKAFLTDFLKTKLNYTDEQIAQFITAGETLEAIDEERVVKVVASVKPVIAEVVETITTDDGLKIAVIDTGMMSAATEVVNAAQQSEQIAAAASAGSEAVHGMFEAGASAQVEQPTQPSAEGAASQREPEVADGAGFAGNADTMSAEMSMQYTSKFLARFDAIRQSMAFNPDWMGDDKGLDAMYESEELRKHVKDGFQVKMVDALGRKIIVTGTKLGPVIVHEAVLGGHQLCFIAPQAMKRSGMIRSQGKYLNGDEIEFVVGSVDGKAVVNIGKSVGMVVSHAAPAKH